MMSKEFIYGNTKVTIFSPLVHMTKEERREYFQTEWKKGNPILRNIAQAAHDCLAAPAQEKMEKYS